MRDFFRDTFWLLVSFGLWAAAFHPLDLWSLAWVAMVPAFCRLLAEGTGRRRLGLAWVASQYWLHAALMSWTGVIAPPLAFLVPMLGIPFSWLTGFLLDRGVVRLKLPLVFAAPLTIVCVEVLRDQALLGLSWASIGYSQWRWLDLIRLASAGRVHLVSLVVLTVNAGIAAAIMRWRAGASWPARLRPVLAAALVLAAGVAGGRLLAPGPCEPGPLAAGLQPNIPQREKMRGHTDPRQVMFGILRIHEQLLREVRPLEPDLLVWSETAFYPVNEPIEPLARLLEGSFPDPEAPEGRRPIRDLVLQGPDQVTILGSIRRTALPPSEKGGPLDDDDDGLDERNVAWVVRGGMATGVAYDKRGLAPFGEYIPLPRGFPGRDLVKSMIHDAVHYIPDLNVGKDPVLFEAPSPSGPKKGGLTICFEAVFPWYYRESARLGADFHVNISNDAWFDDSCELELVDVAAIFRAVETGRALFRVSNSGISTLIGPGGDRLAVAHDGSGRRTQVRGTVHGQIPIAHGKTGYVRWGDTPWILPSAALLTALAVGTIRRKRFLPGVSVR